MRDDDPFKITADAFLCDGHIALLKLGGFMLFVGALWWLTSG